jgi:hypothetical protein
VGSITPYILPNLLSDGSSLTLHSEKGILSLLSEGNLVKQELLTPLEMQLIAALLEAYPNYCKNEVLLSIQTNESIESSREQILDALKDQMMHEVTKRLRAMLARCRKKLHPFGIDIVTLHGLGCILGPLNHEARVRNVHNGMVASKSDS